MAAESVPIELAPESEVIHVVDAVHAAFTDVTSGPEFVDSRHGTRSVVARWLIEADDSAFRFTKEPDSLRITPHHADVNVSDVTRLTVWTGGDKMRIRADGQYRPPHWLTLINEPYKHPDELSDDIANHVVGRRGLTVGDILRHAVDLSPAAFDDFLAGAVPNVTADLRQMAHVEGFDPNYGGFSIRVGTALHREGETLHAMRKLQVNQRYSSHLRFGATLESMSPDAPTLLTNLQYLDDSGEARILRRPGYAARVAMRAGGERAGIDEQHGSIGVISEEDLQQVHLLTKQMTDYFQAYIIGYSDQLQRRPEDPLLGSIALRGYTEGYSYKPF